MDGDGAGRQLDQYPDRGRGRPGRDRGRGGGGHLPGHAHLVQQTAFTSFLATLGSAVLTFLAGAEIDPISLRRHWKPSLTIGAVSFAVPFAAAMAFTYYVLGWNLHAAEIGGTALSTTSVAVVYAVMIETGLNRTDLGKLILAACFITDLGTVLALGVLFAQVNWLLLVFVAVTAASLTPAHGDRGYIAHSTRAGFATQAAANGASERAIMDQGRWKSLQVARTYIRRGVGG